MAKTKLFTADDAREHFTDLLTAEASRFEALAKDAAIKWVTSRDAGGEWTAAQKELHAKCQAHLIRVETFKAAAALVAGKAAS